MLGAAPFQMRDPVCAGAVVAQANDIGEAMAAIAIDHPTMLKYLQSGGSMAKYLKLAFALKPIADTVRDHHFGADNASTDSAGYPPGAMVPGAA